MKKRLFNLLSVVAIVVIAMTSCGKTEEPGIDATTTQRLIIAYDTDGKLSYEQIDTLILQEQLLTARIKESVKAVTLIEDDATFAAELRKLRDDAEFNSHYTLWDGVWRVLVLTQPMQSEANRNALQPLYDERRIVDTYLDQIVQRDLPDTTNISEED